MAYVAKPKRISKIKWKIIVPLFVVISVGLVMGYRYQQKKAAAAVNTFGICELNNIDTLALVKNYENQYEIQEFLFYGETLNFFSSPYELNSSDDLYGKTISLINLCTQEENVYMVENKVDGQIPLEDLDDGVYEIFVNKSLDQLRMTYPEEVSEVFYTVTRNNTNKKITIKADQSMFSDENNPQILTANYLYLIVETVSQPEDYYDIIIDPSAHDIDGGYSVDDGYRANGLIEAEENLRLANLLKDDLTAMGLKVLLARTDDEVVNSYGVDGKLYRGYQAHCRYYIDINQMAANNTNYRGTKIYYSNYSSNKLAMSVLKSIIENTSLVTTDTSLLSGALTTSLVDEFDGNKMIRESGGKILKAGVFSEKSAENASFNKDNIYGMQTISIAYIYLTNLEDVTIWNDEIDNIAYQTALGIAQYLRIGE